MTTERLDPLELDLHGRCLIEASAGTGKTWTIAALMLRLVLNHGTDATAFGRKLQPSDVLVSTFTIAATAELRERIRARLEQAAAAFADPAPPADAWLGSLRAGIDAARWPAAARDLRLAAQGMDQAAILTLDAFALRMLQEHAFDSASLFTLKLEPHVEDLLQEAARDHWREHVVDLPPAALHRWRMRWRTPESLAADVADLLNRLDQIAPEPRPPAELLADFEVRSPLLKSLVLQPPAGLDWLAKARADTVRAWNKRVAAWGRSTGPFAKFSDAQLREMRKSLEAALNAVAPSERPRIEQAIEALELLPPEKKGFDDVEHALLRHAVHAIAARVRRAKAERAVLSFPDLQLRLIEALDGPQGAQLAARIRQQFPVALIDEFQDTDPRQWAILHKVWPDPKMRDGALLLIGDPKQAIYGFRGADVFTYLAARLDARLVTLDRNFRSTAELVEAVNHVFASAPQPFVLDHDARHELPFTRVQAADRPERLWVDGAPQKAMTFWPPAEGGDGAEATACAIATLLAPGRAAFRRVDGAGEPQPLQPGDIAILVASRNEAATVRRALMQHGIRSVYLSERDSVFDSAVAADLERWLAALAAPRDARLLRAALGSATLGLPLAHLDRLQHDESAWEAEVLRFEGLAERWRRDGVMPMLRALMHAYDVPARLLAQRQERALTDLLHLAEWLQQRERLVDGPLALQRALAQEAGRDSIDEDARRVRLEADDALVKVVTVHGSKGLEYPLVFLPWGARAERHQGSGPRHHHDAHGRPVLDFGASDDGKQRADAEMVAEGVRKLYVAFTRARHALWVGALDAGNVSDKNPLARLLGLPKDAKVDRWRPALDRLAAGLPGAIAVADPPPAPARPVVPRSAITWAPAPALPAPRPPWSFASYSSLLQQGDVAIGPPAWLAQSAQEQAALEDDEAQPAAAADAATAAAALRAAGTGLHAFPRGREPGTFLHSLLEASGRRGFVFDHVADAPAVTARAAAAGHAAHAGVLVDWLDAFTRTPLPLDPHGAVEAAPAQWRPLQVEMEFWLPTAGVDVQAIDRLVCAATFDAAPRPPLARQQLAGMLKGYIDLAFGHGGRWYIADHKSNHLGPDDAAYTPEALAQAMLGHRYDLQGCLYLVALHRLLRRRLGAGYDPEAQLGSALFLFLRGHAAPGRGVLHLRPPIAMIDALDRLLRGEPEGSRA